MLADALSLEAVSEGVVKVVLDAEQYHPVVSGVFGVPVSRWAEQFALPSHL